jgi:malic enzyme
MVFLKILLISIVIIGLGTAGIAIKMFFKKGYTFKKQCSTVDPNTGKRLGCACGTDSCHNGGDKKEKSKVVPALVSVETYHEASR